MNNKKKKKQKKKKKIKKLKKMKKNENEEKSRSDKAVKEGKEVLVKQLKGKNTVQHILEVEIMEKKKDTIIKTDP